MNEDPLFFKFTDGSYVDVRKITSVNSRFRTIPGQRKSATTSLGRFMEIFQMQMPDITMELRWTVYLRNGTAIELLVSEYRELSACLDKFVQGKES